MTIRHRCSDLFSSWPFFPDILSNDRSFASCHEAKHSTVVFESLGGAWVVNNIEGEVDIDTGFLLLRLRDGYELMDTDR